MQKNVRSLITLNVLFFSAIGLVYTCRVIQQRNLAEAKLRSEGADYVRSKMLTGDEYVRACHVNDSVKETHRISDDDLDWTLEAIKHPTVSKGGLDWGPARNMMFTFSWRYLTDITPEQRDKMFQAACRYLPNSGLQYKPVLTKRDKMSGVALAYYSKDKRAIPLLQGLLQDPDAHIREGARKIIIKLNG